MCVYIYKTFIYIYVYIYTNVLYIDIQVFNANIVISMKAQEVYVLFNCYHSHIFFLVFINILKKNHGGVSRWCGG